MFNLPMAVPSCQCLDASSAVPGEECHVTGRHFLVDQLLEQGRVVLCSGPVACAALQAPQVEVRRRIYAVLCWRPESAIVGKSEKAPVGTPSLSMGTKCCLWVSDGACKDLEQV